MYKAAMDMGGDKLVFNGFLLLDKMSIQQDLTVLKKGEYWELIGGVDLGPLVNDLEQISTKKKPFQLATHCFQYIYQSFGSFRWLVAYYGSHNVNGHSIYMMCWPLLDVISSFGFNIHAAIMDGSSNNHQFGRCILNHNCARILKYVTTNPYDCLNKVALVQDCKHTFKKNLQFYFGK